MAKLTKFLVLFVALGILALGCQNQPNMVEPQSAPPAPSAKITLENGSTFESATLYVHILDVSGQSVDVHRITSDWDEGTVTWNNFGSSYASAVEGSFVADAYDWRTVDLTSLVESWMLGTYDNFGVLLDQVTKAFPRTRYFAHESGMNIPFLRVCYSTSGGTVCDDYPAIADAYIHEANPDFNNGYAATFYTGWAFDTDLEKQAMLQFDLPTIPQLAAIGDTVWYDDDNDGIQDGGELGAPGVTVNLYDCADNLLATTVTDADGFYIFDDLTPGDYYVEFIPPEGYDFSPQDQGMDDAKDSDADPITGKTICTTLDAGERDMTWDAGLYMPPHEGCTLTIGFWKTHAGFGPQANVVSPLLPIWLGTPGGTCSIPVTDSAIAHDILLQNVYGHPDNGLTKLYAQLLGAKLNIASGASESSVKNTISKADEFIADNCYGDWDSLSSADQAKVLRWHDKLDDYNNGIIGPGHCD
jgi:hypothetical protein